MAPGTVTLEISNRIGLLTLNQPENLNAMNEEMAAGFKEAIHGLKDSSEAKALVLTGAGRAFSAGGNLNLMKEMLGQDPGVYKANIYGFYRSFLSIMELKIPTIAAVNGPAMGLSLIHI